MRDHDEIHKKYGKVVRVAPNEISFAQAEAWQEIYTYRPNHKEVTKDTVWYIGSRPQEMEALT